MLAFAGNSLLCRAALLRTAIDPASFTALRLLSGAAMLMLLAAWRQRRAGQPAGAAHDCGPALARWWSPLALFAYAAGFSFAYAQLGAATGALLLFGAVQATMIGASLWRGERLCARQRSGLGLALAGLAVLLLPGWAAPPPGPALLMLGAGVAWAVYSLRGRAARDPLAASAMNFARAALAGLALVAAFGARLSIDGTGLALALASGALASGLGYVFWYAALPHLTGSAAATVQLSVPVLTALGGVALLGELPGPQLLAAGVAILGGIALVLVRPASAH
ncbi:DMT family transporter [Derxia lacustris]|uniref:DMT family transporter n=1 Tax=Derxia lacustris TaxID=764842 RepID=UPI002E2569CA